MKKVIAILLLSALILTMFGCNLYKKGQKAEVDSSTSTAAEQTEKPVTSEPIVTTTTLPAPQTTQAVIDIPLKVVTIDLKINWLGTPEAYIQFKNISNKRVVAYDCEIICYNAYGEQINSFGNASFKGTSSELIEAGGYSSKDSYWALSMFDNATRIKVAITRFRLDGENTVEIPSNQMQWVIQA